MKCQHCAGTHADRAPCVIARLVRDAAEALEFFGEDELEAYAEKQRAARRARMAPLAKTDPLALALEDLAEEK